MSKDNSTNGSNTCTGLPHCSQHRRIRDLSAHVSLSRPSFYVASIFLCRVHLSFSRFVFFSLLSFFFFFAFFFFFCFFVYFLVFCSLLLPSFFVATIFLCRVHLSLSHPSFFFVASVFLCRVYLSLSRPSFSVASIFLFPCPVWNPARNIAGSGASLQC